jgi:hypothetical protein
MKKIIIGFIFICSLFSCSSIPNEFEQELSSLGFPIAIEHIKVSGGSSASAGYIDIKYKNISDKTIKEIVFNIYPLGGIRSGVNYTDRYLDDDILRPGSIRTSSYNNRYVKDIDLVLVSVEIDFENGGHIVLDRNQSSLALLKNRDLLSNNRLAISENIQNIYPIIEISVRDLNLMDFEEWEKPDAMQDFTNGIVRARISAYIIATVPEEGTISIADDIGASMTGLLAHWAKYSENIERRYDKNKEYRIGLSLEMYKIAGRKYGLKSVAIDFIDDLVSVEELAELDRKSAEEEIAEEERIAKEAEAAQQARWQALEEEGIKLQEKLAQAKGYKNLSWGSDERTVEALYPNLKDITNDLEIPKQFLVLQFSRSTYDRPNEIRFYFVNNKLYMTRESYGLINNEDLIKFIFAGFFDDLGNIKRVEFGSLVQYSHESNPITHSLLTLNYINRNSCRIDGEFYNPDFLELSRRIREEE